MYSPSGHRLISSPTLHYQNRAFQRAPGRPSKQDPMDANGRLREKCTRRPKGPSRHFGRPNPSFIASAILRLGFPSWKWGGPTVGGNSWRTNRRHPDNCHEAFNIGLFGRTGPASRSTPPPPTWNDPDMLEVWQRQDEVPQRINIPHPQWTFCGPSLGRAPRLCSPATSPLGRCRRNQSHPVITRRHRHRTRTRLARPGDRVFVRWHPFFESGPSRSRMAPSPFGLFKTAGPRRHAETDVAAPAKLGPLPPGAASPQRLDPHPTAVPQPLIFSRSTASGVTSSEEYYETPVKNEGMKSIPAVNWSRP